VAQGSGDGVAASAALVVGSRRARSFGWVVAAIPVAATVGTYGELSPEAFVAVSVAGLVLMTIGLRRRVGAGAAAVPRTALWWLGWLVLVSLWELWTKLHDAQYPTLSDLMDPVLAHHWPRALATVAWFAVGVWLLRRPSGVPEDVP
jgi:hypothetical protein